MHSTIKAMTLAVVASSLWLGAAPAMARSAPPLSQVEILKVESSSCGLEDVSDGRDKTACDHQGPNIKVYVLEIGYGRQPRVALDGFEVNGTRAAVCEEGSSLVPCGNSGITVGYIYTFDLAGKQEGTFTFSNTSLNAPGNSMSAQIYIK
ncbi:DUF4879 domain-containing protein [Pseudomonas chlororaphis subsp. piscium]|uniref:DUF4879 domain-containing protein n=1 Tax=Pseudomonas TaxID=286 RepID=UPI000471EA1A|nr:MULTISPECIES: DUF4879 domain-containing protein [Pseudomonas]PMY35326.1 DUF4879 domain-containing protein [Pseudomonas sp. FW306-2-2C-D06C]PYC31351.1 DUF4879 domain-containing protein [Pseudomonas chlororaphis]